MLCTGISVVINFLTVIVCRKCSICPLQGILIRWATQYLLNISVWLYSNGLVLLKPCCTIGGVIWRGGVYTSTPIFHPHQCKGGAWAPKTDSSMEFQNINAAQRRFLAGFLRNFRVSWYFLLGLTNKILGFPQWIQELWGLKLGCIFLQIFSAP